MLPVDISKLLLDEYVDSDQMPHSAASDLSLHCLNRPIYPQYLGLLQYCSYSE